VAVLYESLSIILQLRAIAYWLGRIQYGTGRIQYGRCRLWIFPPPRAHFCVTRPLENGAVGAVSGWEQRGAAGQKYVGCRRRGGR